MGAKSESYELIPALELSTGYPRSIFPILSAQPIIPILFLPWLGACMPVTHASRRGAEIADSLRKRHPPHPGEPV
jgi:hypothetical protein